MDEEEEISLPDNIGEIFSGMTIDEAIEAKKEEVSKAHERYEVDMEVYKIVSKNTNKAIITLTYYQIKAKIDKLMAIIQNSGNIELYDLKSNKISAFKKTLIEERELLLDIKKSLIKIKKYNIIETSEELGYLIALLYEYNLILTSEYNDYMTNISLASRGIEYYSNKSFDKQLEDASNNIIIQSIKLGLYKSKELSGNDSDN